jgi:hypothetical protein
MKSLIVCFLLAVLIIGCGTLPQYTGQSKLNSIDGEGKFSEIRMDLLRASMSGMAVQRVGYYAEAVPNTQASERAWVQEQCTKNLETADKCKPKIEERLKLFEQKKCFSLTINTMVIQHAKPEMWKVKIEQPQGKFLDGEILGFKAVPGVDSGSQARPFSNSGSACFPKELDFKQRMKMFVIPQFGGSDAGALELVWEAPK